ncbi:MAG TPA: hypothetical protein VIJ06_06155 [Methylovirgula sp.]
MDTGRHAAYGNPVAAGVRFPMFRLLFRTIGFFMLAAAFADLVVDGTRSIAGGALSLTPLDKTLAWLAPDKIAGLKPAIERLNPFLWDPVMIHFLVLPTWVVIGVLGALIMALTRKRRPKIGYSSR